MQVEINTDMKHKHCSEVNNTNITIINSFENISDSCNRREYKFQSQILRRNEQK